MPPRSDDTLWELEAHSRGKHRILRAYMDTSFPIMTKYHRRVVVVNGFAGPGRYLGGEPGSPLVMLDAFEHSYRPHMNSEIVYLFIEERADRVAHLQQEIDAYSLPANVIVDIAHGQYEDVFGAQLRELQSAGEQLAPTFSFVDPFRLHPNLHAPHWSIFRESGGLRRSSTCRSPSFRGSWGGTDRKEGSRPYSAARTGVRPSRSTKKADDCFSTTYSEINFARLGHGMSAPSRSAAEASTGTTSSSRPRTSGASKR